jgi:hypothetical protein
MSAAIEVQGIEQKVRCQFDPQRIELGACEVRFEPHLVRFQIPGAAVQGRGMAGQQQCRIREHVLGDAVQVQSECLAKGVVRARPSITGRRIRPPS